MKKLLSIMISCIMILSLMIVPTSAVYAVDAGEHTFDGIVYNDNGVVTGYIGSSKTVEIPSLIYGTTIHSIGSFAFSCKEIDTVIIDDGIEYINSYAFFDSEISHVEIPVSVIEIDESAFSGCKNLSKVNLDTLGAEMTDGCFSGTPRIELTLPCLFDKDMANELFSKAKGDSDYEIVTEHTKVKRTVKGKQYDFCDTCGTTFIPRSMSVISVFPDVSDSAWYCRSIMESYNLGILAGKDTGKFEPDASMKVAEAAKIAAVLYAYKNDASVNFNQNEGSHWYDTYVNYCISVGIIANKSDFDYTKPATRAEMAYLFSKADMDYPYVINGDFAISNIPDVTLDMKYGNEIYDLYLKGIANGKDNYRYYPNSNVKRSEAAALVVRFLDYDERIVF